MGLLMASDPTHRVKQGRDEGGTLGLWLWDESWAFVEGHAKGGNIGARGDLRGPSTASV